jgi:hypothetical protein
MTTTTATTRAPTAHRGSPRNLGPVRATPRPVHRSLPSLRRCSLAAEAADGGLLGAGVGGGASCATAREVLLRVSHWDGRTCRRVCPRHVLMVHDFVCSTYVIGEAEWSVDCWKGRQVIHTSLAD